MNLPWHPVAGGVRVMVRARPKAKAGAVASLTADAEGRALLCLSVRAAPVEGAANVALGKLLAALAEVAPSHVTLEAGGQAKLKRFHIRGDAGAIMARLAQKISEESRP